VGTHHHKPLNQYGAATVELLRVSARAGPAVGSRRRSGIGRRVRAVALLVAVQLIAAACGADLVTVVEVYGALAAIGVVPVWRQPYSLSESD